MDDGMPRIQNTCGSERPVENPASHRRELTLAHVATVTTVAHATFRQRENAKPLQKAMAFPPSYLSMSVQIVL